MAQDLREMFKKETTTKEYSLPNGHRQRFSKLLDKELPQKTRNGTFKWGIAASILVTIGVGTYLYHTQQASIPENVAEVDSAQKEAEVKTISLGDLSPDLKKVEEYYVVNINMELSKLDITGENKTLVNSYIKQLGTLDQEYKTLNNELNMIGPNDQTVTALIKNLQLRLQLLLKLKNKLNELKSSENETATSNSI